MLPEARLPARGDIVQVRHRSYLVEEVVPPPARGDATLARLRCLDDDAQGRPLEVLWELELGARIHEPGQHGLGEVARLDEPRTFAAYLHALKWNCVSATDARLFQAPFRAGYFNALRELGGMRRLVQDEVHSRVARIQERVPVEQQDPWFRNREIKLEPVELTSRESTTAIAKAKDRLAKPYAEGGVDVLLASNMISVGVDIERLGLMVVAGQPKSTSEYIQATSRVGRDPKRPGLVVTVYNVHKPRDRSYYERFAAYHAAFYRFVEAQSVTPFSGPALDRGLAAVLVSLTRLRETALTPSAAVMELPAHAELGELAGKCLAARATAQAASAGERQRLSRDVAQQAHEILETWKRIVLGSRNVAGARCYSPWDQPHSGKPLLSLALQAEDEETNLTADDKVFTAPTSMRDVERTVALWIERHPLGGKGEKNG